MVSNALLLESLPHLLSGVMVTLKIALASFVIGITGGTFLGVLHTCRTSWMRLLVSGYVGLIRGTPMLIQITFFYFVLPRLGITFSAATCAILAIGINSSAYVSQIIKSGINAVGKEQVEAAQVLGFSRFQIAYYIVLPQAIRYVLPALANEGVTLIKDSSLASVIGVSELYKESRAIVNQTYDVVSVFIIVALLYLVLTSTVSAIAYYIQQRMDNHA